MGVVNIVDRRKNKYRFQKINAVVEATWHDNSVEDSDQSTKPANDGPSYEEKEHISLEASLAWGASFSTPVTLYIYGPDDGIYQIDRDERSR